METEAKIVQQTDFVSFLHELVDPKTLPFTDELCSLHPDLAISTSSPESSCPSFGEFTDDVSFEDIISDESNFVCFLFIL